MNAIDPYLMVAVRRADLERLFEDAFNDVRVTDMKTDDIALALRVQATLEASP